MVWALKIFLAGLLVLFVPEFARPGKMAIRETPDVVVHYDEPLQGAAQRIGELYPGIKRELEAFFGWEMNAKPVVVLVRDGGVFAEMTGSPHVVAFAVPEKQLVVIDHSKMHMTPFTLEVTLKHEMCHIMVGVKIPDGRLPLWLNEGFCQLVTGGIAELMTAGVRPPNLNKAALSRQLIPLTSLGRRFPQYREGLYLAYGQSKSVLNYMMTKFGRTRVLQILDYLSEGYTVEEAVPKALSLSVRELEAHWVEHLQGHMSWIGYLASNVYLIILFGAALLTVGGFVRYAIRRRRRVSRAEEDDEDFVDFKPDDRG